MPLARDGQSGRFRRLIGLKRVLVANLAVFAVIGWGFSGEVMRDRTMQKEVDRLKAEADELEAKNLELVELGKRFSTTEMLERQARLKLNLRKPGEEVVVVRQGNGQPDGGDPVPARVDDGGLPRSNVGRWWHYFFR